MLCDLPACPAAAQMLVLVFSVVSWKQHCSPRGELWIQLAHHVRKTHCQLSECSALQLASLSCCPGSFPGADRICGHLSASLSPTQCVHILFQLGLLQPGLLAAAGWDLSSGCIPHLSCLSEMSLAGVCYKSVSALGLVVQLC